MYTFKTAVSERYTDRDLVGNMFILADETERDPFADMVGKKNIAASKKIKSDAKKICVYFLTDSFIASLDNFPNNLGVTLKDTGKSVPAETIETALKKQNLKNYVRVITASSCEELSYNRFDCAEWKYHNRTPF